jgi:Zn-finger nucleic acid-binding protein
MRLKCPVDGVDMDEKTVEVVETVKLDVCPKCDGIWMDKGELRSVSKDELIEYKFTDRDEGARLCPRCKSRMKREELNGVVVDSCGCGIYFDKGEADKILGRRLAFRAGEGYSVGVTVDMLKELISKGKIAVGTCEIRLLKEHSD